MTALHKLPYLAFVISVFAARADEPIRSRREAQRLGYRSMSRKSVEPNPELPDPHTLAWPVNFKDAAHSMGNVMTQYQNYDSLPYFHGGCDLRTQAGASIVTPLGGRLNGGHYTYVTNGDGSLEKQMKPWPETGDSNYFEISVTTDDGLLLEFHHVDRATLPARIRSLLDQGEARVEAGEEIGRVLEWDTAGVDGDYYHHTHYNLITTNGVRLNPEYYSTVIHDTLAPEITGVFGVSPSGLIERATEGVAFATRPEEIIVATTDRKSENVYIHAPSIVEALFENGPAVRWDFRERLTDSDGQFPAIYSVFKKLLVTPEGETLYTKGDYENNSFLIKLKVPPTAGGTFTIRVGDAAGNVREMRAATP